ncbi:hypothetical protein [Elizabethkingia miricola]|uniref:hypothetical protein n=1 Tax=Elizabethkingia miricola TaxID=172045 RepID=UPI00099AD018|nr:hypothetical protein [Elizabethkingia miricola]OPC08197.1 hypothetical protein BAY01_17595 [Elizabethkingia miricola]
MKKITFYFLALIAHSTFGQTAKVSSEYGSKDPVINQLMDFQDITAITLTLQAKELIGKYSLVKIKEFTNGKLSKTENIISPEEGLAIQSTPFTLRLFTETNKKNNILNIAFRANHFGTPKKEFLLKENKYSYVLHDLISAQKIKNLDLRKETPIFIIMTPYVQSDGSASYCEVSGSEISPDQLGRKYNIPHYFIITLQFLEQIK